MKEIRGVIFVIISAVIFGFMPIGAKYIYAEGCNSASLTFYRYGLSLLLLFLLALREQAAGTGKLPHLKKVLHISALQLKQFVILSLGFCMTPLLLFASYQYISAGSATTIHFSYPVFVILASVFIFKEKVSSIKKAGIFFCFLGLLLFYERGQTGGVTGIFLALASGVTYSFYMMYFDRSILKFIKPFKANFYISLISAIIAFAFSMVTDSFILLKTPESWGMASVFSFMVTVVACVLLQIGISTIGAQKSAVLSTFEPITSVVLGFLLFQEQISFKTAAGVIFILIAVLCITLFDKQKMS